MDTTHQTSATLIIVLLLFLSGCRNDRQMPTPPSDATYTVSLRSADGTTDLGEEGKVENDKAVITGLGYYKAGVTAKVVVTPKEGFTCEGIYFEYQSGYDAAKFPTTSETALSSSEVSFEVKGNITIHAIVTDEQEGGYAKNVLVNEDYWKEQNQKAWDEIYPKIVQEPQSDYEDGYTAQIIGMCYPNLYGAMRTDTIYSGEATILSFAMQVVDELYPDDMSFPRETPTYEEGYRVAYALADRATGEIREIYPPLYWDGRGTRGTNGNILVYPTLPEGDYIFKVLLNTPERRDKWYDLPLRDWCRFEPFKNDHIHMEYDDIVYDYDARDFTEWGIVCRDRLKYEQLFFTEKIRNIHVSERNTEAAPPIPRWYRPRAYRSLIQTEDQHAHFSGLLILNGGWDNGPKSCKLKLVNGCNKPLRGKIIAVTDYHHWYDKNLHILDQYVRHLREWVYPPGGGRDPNGCLPEWSVVVGKKDGVEVPGNSTDTEISIIYKNPVTINEGKAWDHYMFGGSGALIFYWQPEGSEKCYFMQQSYHDIMNVIEEESKSGNPYTNMWIGTCYETNPILSQSVVEHYPELMDGGLPNFRDGYEWQQSYCNFLNFDAYRNL